MTGWVEMGIISFNTDYTGDEGDSSSEDTSKRAGERCEPGGGTGSEDHP